MSRFIAPQLNVCFRETEHVSCACSEGPVSAFAAAGEPIAQNHSLILFVISLIAERISLLMFLGKLPVSRCFCVINIGHKPVLWPETHGFPVNFPVSREFGAETGWLRTDSTASVFP